MNRTSHWIPTLIALALALALSACTTGTPKERATTPFTDELAVDLLWGYEQALRPGGGDPKAYVTGLERQWLDRFLADQAAGQRPAPTWVATAATIKVEKASEHEALVTAQYTLGGRLQTTQFRFQPEGGQWRIANHQTPNGKWWAP